MHFADEFLRSSDLEVRGGFRSASLSSLIAYGWYGCRLRRPSISGRLCLRSVSGTTWPTAPCTLRQQWRIQKMKRGDGRQFINPVLIYHKYTQRSIWIYSLYYGLPKIQLNRLQHIQNSLARAVVAVPRSSDANQILKHSTGSRYQIA